MYGYLCCPGMESCPRNEDEVEDEDQLELYVGHPGNLQLEFSISHSFWNKFLNNLIIKLSISLFFIGVQCTRSQSYYLFSDWLGHMHAKCHAHDIDQFLWQQTMISLLPGILPSATTLSSQYTFTFYHPISPSSKKRRRTLGSSR